MKNADLPAMPLSGDAYQDFASYDETKNTSYNPDCQGLTKREIFAMHAISTVLSKYDPWENGNFDSSDWQETAENCVGIADALLAELEK